MEGMLSVAGNSICSGNATLVTVCLALGTLVGEMLNIEDLFESFGQWLKLKTEEQPGYAGRLISFWKRQINVTAKSGISSGQEVMSFSFF